MNRFIPGIIFCLLTLSMAYAGRQAEGMVLPKKEVVVSSRTQNVIGEIAVEEGDTVKEGDVLATLDLRIKELEAERFEKVLAMRESEFESSQNLFKDNIISREEAMKAEIERDLARIQHEIAREEVELNIVKSPLDGIVVEVAQEAGETVSSTDPMFRVINIDEVFVQIFLSEEDVYLLKVGQKLPVSFPHLPGENTFSGTVDFIDPRIDATSGFLRVKILVKNPEHSIRAGMRGLVALPDPT